MARLNPRRRLLQRQGAILAKARIERALEGDDSAKMQQGNVKCPMERPARNFQGMATPRHTTIAPDWFKDGASSRPQKDMANRAVRLIPKSRLTDAEIAAAIAVFRSKGGVTEG